MQFRNASLGLRRSVAARGWLRTFVHFIRRATPAGGRPERANRVHPFDREYGLETSGLISGRDLAGGHPNDLQSTAYYGIAPSIFKHAIQEWARTLQETGLSLSQFAFVDLGAGKGRAILLASEYGFRSVVGVELNSGLAEAAERNAERWKEMGRSRSEITVVNADAASFSWPSPPLLVFLFNPFGRHVLAEVLHNLKREVERSGQMIDVLYINPEFKYVPDRFPGLQKVWSRKISMSEADQAVDAFSSQSELCNAYRFAFTTGSAARN